MNIVDRTKLALEAQYDHCTRVELTSTVETESDFWAFFQIMDDDNQAFPTRALGAVHILKTTGSGQMIESGSEMTFLEI